MPIRPEVRFSETTAAVTVTVEMRAGGLSRQRLEVLCSPLFIKLSCLPYLLALDLYERVDYRSAHCTVDDASSQVILHLPKSKQGLWGMLSPAGTELSKDALMKRRQQSIEEANEWERRAAEATHKTRALRDKKALERQMTLESDERREVERAQQEEAERQHREIARMKSVTARDRKAGDEEPTSSRYSETSVPHESHVVSELIDGAQYCKEIGPGTGLTAEAPSLVSKDVIDERNEEKASSTFVKRSGSKALPMGPRPSSCLAVSFTEREPGPAGGALPARESRVLRPVSMNKQSEGAGGEKGGSIGEDKTLAERQPVLLKDKGDSFLKCGDRKSAIVAYNEAILKLSSETCSRDVVSADTASDIRVGCDGSEMLCNAARLNRSVCFMMEGEYKQAIADCDATLESLHKGGVSKAPEKLLPVTAQGLPLDDGLALQVSKDLERMRVMAAKAYARRSVCRQQLVMDKEQIVAGLEPGPDEHLSALNDIEMAKEYDRNNAEFYHQGVREIEGCLCPANITQMHEMNARLDFAHALKDLGDSQFARRNYAHAIHIYSLAEQRAKNQDLSDSLWSAKTKSNKAASLLALQRFDDAIHECDGALNALVGCTASTVMRSDTALCEAALVEWSGRQRSQSESEAFRVLRKILLRKAACQTHSKEYEEGLATLSILKLCLTTQSDVYRDQLAAIDEDCERIRKIAAEAAYQTGGSP